MKFIYIILIIVCELFFCHESCFAWTIPQTTLDIAKEAGYTCIPNSKLVRVGIGNQNFSSYIWNNVSVYATGEFEIYDKDNYIDTYDANNTINITLSDKKFVIKNSSGNKIAEFDGPIKFKTDFGYIGIRDLKRGGKDALYRGEIHIVRASSNEKFHVINVIDSEEYLKGVVPNEMPVRFGLEALKAQTIAARNYVLSPRVKANPNYDVVDSVASQVYFGANTEKELSNQAIQETMGIVAIYDWELILALYSSTAGGYTENYENAFSDPLTKSFPAKPKPYLKGKPDLPNIDDLSSEKNAEKFYTTSPKSFDEKSSYYRWTKEWSANELQKEIQDHIAALSATGFVHPAVNKGEVIGKILRINVLQRGVSGKIMKLEIVTDNANYTIEKELVIRRMFTQNGKTLPSANLVFKQEFDNNGNLVTIKAFGGGFGHGVGLSQFGAGYMASELHLPYESILQHYYDGISLTTEPIVLSAKAGENTVSQNFYLKKQKANLVVDNKFHLEYIDANINYKDVKIELNKFERINKIDISQYLQKGINTITFNYPLNLGTNKSIKLYIEIAGKNEYGK